MLNPPLLISPSFKYTLKGTYKHSWASLIVDESGMDLYYVPQHRLIPIMSVYCHIP